ncbi:glycosyltransferase family 2 protein [Plebeiibacterium sediminum]|uniref:Glycosyltransferase n=1 Tax=Plebeiibacterium sediminum TaxID=2992112 RepID=A0AAE3M7X6_9BACT|nr:glycosyltransferase family 2 protein [Plebeiobacterium sediminum]MCW3788631.1 glycosyltransferase [Plebeiobacterium sediminum]
MNHNTPKISIVTVVYNGAQTIEATINSIINQTYKNIEYIIVDGDSNDGTQDIIKSYESEISKWISEPDKGIYDAMNKGIDLSTGDYIWFMNSGDEIADLTVLEEIISANPGSDIYYGDTVMIDSDGTEIGNRRLAPPEHLTWKSFKKGMLVSHQSFIAKINIIESYNLSYRFSADFEWCLLAIKRAKHITNTHRTLSKFLDGGITKQNIIPGLKERFRIMSKYYGLIPTCYNHIFIGIKFFYFYTKNKRF